MLRNCCFIIFLVVVTTISVAPLYAQPQFIVKGKIEFERKVNLHKQMDNDQDGAWREMMKKAMPPVKTSYFDLLFDNHKTLYRPGREIATTQSIPEWINGPATDNTVYTDLEKEMFASQKTVFESTFNISDSTKKFKWKITADTRTIAGFECRKATTIIMDSVFVFAFYSDQITTPGGPESFNGLPGMILGVAIPRMNTTWFATKLQLEEIKPSDLTPPKKGKKTTLTSLTEILQDTMKNWGKWRDKNMWQIFI
jgi:GLPGLI family protein